MAVEGPWLAQLPGPVRELLLSAPVRENERLDLMLRRQPCVAQPLFMPTAGAKVLGAPSATVLLDAQF